MGAEIARYEERLPWLADSPAPQPKQRSRAPLLAGVPLLILLLLFAGLYWLGRQRAFRAPSAGVARQTVILPEPSQPVPAPQPGSGAPWNTPLKEPLPQVLPPAPDARRKSSALSAAKTSPVQEQKPPKPAAVRSPAAPRSVAAGKAPTPSPSSVPPAIIARQPAQPPPIQPQSGNVYGFWPTVPAATSLGRMIQIGAYSSFQATDTVWKQALSRYPQLRGLPKIVAPFRASDGRQYYRLQIMTAARAQSLWLCSKMRADRRSCVVLG